MLVQFIWSLVFVSWVQRPWLVGYPWQHDTFGEHWTRVCDSRWPSASHLDKICRFRSWGNLFSSLGFCFYLKVFLRSVVFKTTFSCRIIYSSKIECEIWPQRAEEQTWPGRWGPDSSFPASAWSWLLLVMCAWRKCQSTTMQGHSGHRSKGLDVLRGSFSLWQCLLCRYTNPMRKWECTVCLGDPCGF